MSSPLDTPVTYVPVTDPDELERARKAFDPEGKYTPEYYEALRDRRLAEHKAMKATEAAVAASESA